MSQHRKSRRFGRSSRSNNSSRSYTQSGSKQNRSTKTIPLQQYLNSASHEVERHNQSSQQDTVGMQSFTEFDLHPKVQAAVVQCGYATPTPIQAKTIPALLEGKDVVGIANTGTGKTAAFLLPAISKALHKQDERVLIIAPTRELALQIVDEFRRFTKGSQLAVGVCIGGTNMKRQFEMLKRNPEFIIGTPGRILDLVERKALTLSTFSTIVLDEVDRMLDIGFRKDILYIISLLATKRQASLFSATLDADTNAIITQFLQNPVTINVKKQETVANIQQEIVRIEPNQSKVQRLHELLKQKEFEKVIVFGRTKRGINKLEKQLRKKGISVQAIHGNKSQNARVRSLDIFKKGSVQALLATDVAARGIDIQGVSHVINFDEPATYQDYVHRIGRTGRAGSVGKALTFVAR